MFTSVCVCKDVYTCTRIKQGLLWYLTLLLSHNFPTSIHVLYTVYLKCLYVYTCTVYVCVCVCVCARVRVCVQMYMNRVNKQSSLSFLPGQVQYTNLYTAFFTRFFYKHTIQYLELVYRHSMYCYQTIPYPGIQYTKVMYVQLVNNSGSNDLNLCILLTKVTRPIHILSRRDIIHVRVECFVIER